MVAGVGLRMPVYEFRCDACGKKSGITARMAEVPASIACAHCASPNTHRIISQIAVHRTELSKLQSLDPKYDRMAAQALRNTPEADPDNLLRRMTPFSAADD